MMLLDDLKKHICTPADNDSYRHLLIAQPWKHAKRCHDVNCESHPADPILRMLSPPPRATITNGATECLTCCRRYRSLPNLNDTTIHGLNRRTKNTTEEHNSSECRMGRPESLEDCVVELSPTANTIQKSFQPANLHDATPSTYRFRLPARHHGIPRRHSSIDTA